MNFLFIGLGSIGQRHLRNLISFSKNDKIFAYRRKYSTPALNYKNKVIDVNLVEKYKIKEIHSLNSLNKFNINAAIVCTPSSFHAKEIINLAKQKIDIFVEKPLCTSLNEISKIKKIIKKNNIINMVGYQLKFNPIIIYLKKKISKIEKNLNFVQINHGESVKNFHPYENYIHSYASRKKLGGGVILTQIHELDYMRYMFDSFSLIKTESLNSKISNLNVDVEDTLSSIFFLKKKNKKILCNINLNYYEIPKHRTIKLILNNGVVEADLNKQIIVENINGKKLIKQFKFNKNDIFIKELKYFYNCVKKKQKPKFIYTILSDLETITLALNIKKKKI